MNEAVAAGLWGLLGGSALVIGAALPFVATLPQRLVAAIMAFGSGILIAAVTFDLIDEAFRQGGFDATVAGCLAGAGIYTAANVWLTRRGARHRKRSGGGPGERQTHASEGGGLAIALGALVDGIPESVVIGVSLRGGATVSLVTLVAVFLSNIPEGLSSAAGMRRAGRSPGYVFGVWCAIAMASGLAALLGNLMLADAGPEIIAAANAIAAGGILAMICDTMIPEAFETTHEYSGLITVTGFLAAFVLSQFGR